MRRERRERVDPRFPVHVTLRALPRVGDLRSHPTFAFLSRVLEEMKERRDFRAVHVRVGPDHVQMLVEAEDERALAAALTSLLSRAARRLNSLMRTRGRIWLDRYQARSRRTPAEVAHALEVVLGEAACAALRGEPIPPSGADPFCSAHPNNSSLVVPARCWLLREGWRCAP